MNSYPWQLASWGAKIEDRKPFYLAVIDGQSRLGFVNSHFFLQFQQAARPAAHTLRSLVDDGDRRRFDIAVTTCLIEEKDILLEVRMKNNKHDRVQWELRCLESIGEGPGKVYCLGYALAGLHETPATGQPATATATPTTATTIAAESTATPAIATAAIATPATATPTTTPTAADTDQTGRAALDREWQARLEQQRDLMLKKVRQASIQAETQERDRIGRELHDNICQILTSAQLFLSCLTRDNEEFDTIKEKTAEIMTMAINEVRMLSHNTVPPCLEEKGLIECIEQLVDNMKATRRFSIDFTSTDLLTIETQQEDLKLTVYRIVQEQLQNIYKYSQASHIRLSLQARNEELHLRITDDGVGFDPKTVRHGLGLDGIGRRAKLFKGKAIFKSAPGKGCSLTVTIPLVLKRIL